MRTNPITSMDLTNVVKVVVLRNNRITMKLGIQGNIDDLNNIIKTVSTLRTIMSLTVGTSRGKYFKRIARTFPTSLYISSRRPPGFEIARQIFSRAGIAWMKVTNAFVRGFEVSGGRSVTTSRFVMS